MKEDEMLMCLIAFVIGYLVARMMRGNGLSVGGQDDDQLYPNIRCKDNPVENPVYMPYGKCVTRNLIKNKYKDVIHNYCDKRYSPYDTSGQYYNKNGNCYDGVDTFLNYIYRNRDETTSTDDLDYCVKNYFHDKTPPQQCVDEDYYNEAYNKTAAYCTEQPSLYEHGYFNSDACIVGLNRIKDELLK